MDHLEFLTVAEAARRLRCSPRTVRNRIAAGQLAAVREGRRWLVPIGAFYAYRDSLVGCHVAF